MTPDPDRCIAKRQTGRHIATMIRTFLSAMLVAAASAQASPVLASSTDWFQTEGGSVRLVTAGKPDSEGRLRGMIDIVLRPGWKTYWRDPGDAGVPPTLDVSRSAGFKGATIDFPAPGRHDEGDFVWMGYDRSVVLPVTFQVNATAQSAEIDADLFLGVCETICIPVKAEFVLDPAADPDNADDLASVEAAFADLPAPARPDFGASVVSAKDGRLVVEATAPGNPDAVDLFVAGDEDYSFGRPEKSIKDGKVVFTMNASGPAAPPPSGGLHYTLTGESGAVNGLLPYF
jgi:DsbC/DsbD-like thiol-disulfide interchange protein